MHADVLERHITAIQEHTKALVEANKLNAKHIELLEEAKEDAKYNDDLSPPLGITASFFIKEEIEKAELEKKGFDIKKDHDIIEASIILYNNNDSPVRIERIELGEGTSIYFLKKCISFPDHMFDPPDRNSNIKVFDIMDEPGKFLDFCPELLPHDNSDYILDKITVNPNKSVNLKLLMSCYEAHTREFISLVISHSSIFPSQKNVCIFACGYAKIKDEYSFEYYVKRSKDI